MDIFDREWCNVFCWTRSGGYAIYHVPRDRVYWTSCFEVLGEFWWQHVVPAKHLLAHGEVEAALALRWVWWWCVGGEVQFVVKNLKVTINYYVCILQALLDRGCLTRFCFFLRA